MTSPSHIVRKKKEHSGHITSEWLGAEGRIYIPPHRLDENRFRFWNRQSPIGALLFSFVSGLTVGGCLALFVRGRNGGRRVIPDMCETDEPFRVPREVAPCLDSMVA